MSLRTFPQRKDSDLLSWSAGFLQKIALQPEDFGVTAAQVAAFSDLQSDFAAKYALATNSNTNSKVNIANKNDARQRLLYAPGGAWELVNIISAHPATNNAVRGELGLRLVADPSPAARPSAAPAMSIVMTRGRIVTVRLRDIEHPEKRGKPENVYGATVLYWCGDEPSSDLSQWRFAMNTSRPVFDVEIPMWVLPGSKVWITAMWFNKKMQSGPAAQARTVRVCDAPARVAQAA